MGKVKKPTPVVICLLFLSVAIALPAQEGCEITVILDGYTYDTLWFGRTYGKREIPDFYGLREADGSYVLKTDKPLASGMYAIIYRSRPNAYEAFQCWLADGERKFTFSAKQRQLHRASVVGSEENDILYRYNRVFKSLQDDLQEKIDRWRYLQDGESFSERVEAEKTLHQFQESLISQYPHSMTAQLIKETMLPLPPDGATDEDWRAEAHRRWLWQKQHYFDHMDISTEGFMRYLQWLGHVDFFLLYLPPPSPDTAIALIDGLFEQLESNPGAYQYYNKYLTTSFARMSQFRLDEVFVHMVRQYVETGKATWPDDDTKRKMIADADRMEKLFVGNQAPDITLYDQQEIPMELSKLTAPYTLMVFWMPDCSHCKKELPRVMEVHEKFKGKGLQVVSVCGKFGEETSSCWEFAEANQFPADWHTVADPQRRSNMGSLFNLMTFPRLFILDGERNILFKRAGTMETWEMEAVLDGLEW